MPFCRNCGEQKTRLNRNSLCSDCSGADATPNESVDVGVTSAGKEGATNTMNDNFWIQMDSLLDKKLSNFEEKLNNIANTLSDVVKIKGQFEECDVL